MMRWILIFTAVNDRVRSIGIDAGHLFGQLNDVLPDAAVATIVYESCIKPDMHNAIITVKWSIGQSGNWLLVAEHLSLIIGH